MNSRNFTSPRFLRRIKRLLVHNTNSGRRSQTAIFLYITAYVITLLYVVMNTERGTECLGCDLGEVEAQGGYKVDVSISEGHRPTEVMNPHDYNYIINNEDFCSGDDGALNIIITVCSDVINFEARTAVRNTWGSRVNLLHSGARMVFILGRSTNSSVQSVVYRENRVHRDIIQENFVDSYKNLSIKSAAMLKWVASYCPRARHVLKTDDDVFVNMKNLVNVLAQVGSTRFILGSVQIGAAPGVWNTSKWYTPKEDFPEKVFPNFCSGTAYIVPASIVMDLYQATLQTKLFWLEDVYITGVCARKIRVPRLNNDRFHVKTLPISALVYSHAISGHYVSSKDMYAIWQELNSWRGRIYQNAYYIYSSIFLIATCWVIYCIYFSITISQRKSELVSILSFEKVRQT